MILNDILARREAIAGLATRYGVHNIRVFGSVAREAAHEDSDVDFLVRIEQGRSYIDLIEFSDALKELLHTEVDVVTENGLSPFLREQILSEARDIGV